MKNKSYHQKVGEYYDKDVDYQFEKRSKENPLLDKIRTDFREITSKYAGKNVLEIGSGPGFDIQWYAQAFPDSQVTGMDISRKMVETAKRNIANLSNAQSIVGDERSIDEKFKDESLDLIYVFFGALNTVEDLQKASNQIHNKLKKDGFAVLTFVNKWYLREMLVQIIKLNFKIAFSRLKKYWGGYSTTRNLDSKCYSPKQLIQYFKQFQLIERKGYSITYPAWYNFKKHINQEQKLERLWQKDQKLQKTIAWSFGEYTLFVFQK